jgi:hypothetical protein
MRQKRTFSNFANCKNFFLPLSFNITVWYPSSFKHWRSLFDTGEQLIAGVIDTSDKYSLANISANFQKNSKWDTQGLGGNCSMKNTWRWKSRVRLPLNIEGPYWTRLRDLCIWKYCVRVIPGNVHCYHFAPIHETLCYKPKKHNKIGRQEKTQILNMRVYTGIQI